MAAVQLFTESLSSLLAREVGDPNTAAELFNKLKCLVTLESTQYGMEDPSCRPSPRSSRCGYSDIMKCDVDIRKGSYGKVVLSDGVAMFQGIGEQIATECKCELCHFFMFSATVSVVVSLGTKLAQLRESVGMHIDLTLLHSCTCVSLATELFCALDHSSNAFVLAQVALQKQTSI